jgi:hypothetical protein
LLQDCASVARGSVDFKGRVTPVPAKYLLYATDAAKRFSQVQVTIKKYGAWQRFIRLCVRVFFIVFVF